MWMNVHAQAPIAPTPEDLNEPLPQLKQKLRHSLLSALLPEKQAQREALYSLEKQLASGGDFKSAIRARDQRLTLEHEIASTQQQLLNPHTYQSAGDAPAETVLAPTAAQLTQLTLDPANKSLTAWVANTSTATWTLPNLPTGGYEVHLRYSLELPEGVSAPGFQIKESLYHLTAPLEHTGAKPAEKKLGILRVSNGSGSLILQSPDFPANAALRIQSIILRSCAQ